MFAVTCSIEAASSLHRRDRAPRSTRPTDSAWAAVSVSEAAISVDAGDRLVERADLRVGAFRRPSLGDARDAEAAESVEPARRARARRCDVELRGPLPLAPFASCAVARHVLLPVPWLSVCRSVPADSGSAKFRMRSRFRDENQPIAHRGDAVDVASAHPGQRLVAAAESRSAGMLTNSRADVGDQRRSAAARLHDDQPRAQVVRRALEPEPRAQVDDRHHLAAREDDAVDERRRVRHARDRPRPSPCAARRRSAARRSCRRP